MPALKTDKKVLRILVTIVLHAMIPILALIFYNLLGQREFMRNWTKESGRLLTKISARHYEEIVSSTKTLLVTLADVNSVKTKNIATCNKTMGNILKGQSLYANIFTLDLKGDVECSGIFMPSPLNGADRQYFIKALETQSFSVGEYTIGRLTKKPVITFAYPVTGFQGKPTGVIAAALDLNHTNSMFSSAGLPRGTSSLLLDHSGIILARYPNEEGWVGKNIKEYNTLTIEEFKKAQDERIIPLSSIPEQEIYYFVDIPEDYYLKTPNSIFFKGLLMTLIVSIGVFAILLADWGLITQKLLIDTHKIK